MEFSLADQEYRHAVMCLQEFVTRHSLNSRVEIFGTCDADVEP